MKDLKKLQDILEAIEAIESYSVSTYDEFLSDGKKAVREATLYNLIIIGEAANHISEEFQEKHSSIPWSPMIGTRNIVIHGYEQVKMEVVWDIIQNDLGDLKAKILKIIGGTK
jgi:uncharacterized protein with HEPN domain